MTKPIADDAERHESIFYTEMQRHIEELHITARDTFDDALSLCESPIEKQLLAALFWLSPDIWAQSAYCGPFRGSARFQISQQQSIGPYRVDFCLTSMGCQIVDESDLRLIIECDGHNFHERTKEQAQRDKSRDRYFVERGWKVLRFTGREIHKDAARCASQVAEIIESISDNARARACKRAAG